MAAFILLVFLGNGQIAAVPYNTRAECQEAGDIYTKHEKVVKARCYAAVDGYISFIPPTVKDKWAF